MSKPRTYDRFEIKEPRFMRQDSYEWNVFLKRLHLTTKKSNRDAICSKCWRIFP